MIICDSKSDCPVCGDKMVYLTVGIYACFCMEEEE